MTKSPSDHFESCSGHGLECHLVSDCSRT